MSDELLQMMVYNYDEEEWTNVVPKDPEWSREETDFLISMCEQFDLRFLVITDRYEVSGHPCLAKIADDMLMI